MKDWNDITLPKILIVFLIIILICSLLGGCVIYDQTSYRTQYETAVGCQIGEPCVADHSCCEAQTQQSSYWKIHYVPTIGLYHYNDSPYWGYYGGYYYYYGYRHIYPWWYYYNYMPSYYYSVSTHVHCNIGHNGYVYRPRGNWRHNNKKHLTYNSNQVHTTGINVKGHSNVPTKWKNNVKTNVRTNTHKVNTNKTYINKSNTNTIKINKSNTNKIKTNKSNNNRININKSNNNRSVKPNRNKRSNNNRKPR